MATSAELGAKGRLVIPAQVRREAGIDVGQSLIASADGVGRIILETPEAVQARVWAAAPSLAGADFDTTADVRAMRADDSRRSDTLAARRAATESSSSGDTIDEAGEALLRALGL